MTGELLPVDGPVNRLPGPRDLKQHLDDEIGRYVHEAREARGEVHTPEDAYPLVRSLHATGELMTEYARAFQGAAKITKEELESELMDISGEQDGLPLGGHTVPDADGDIALTLDQANRYDIDLDQVLQAYISAEGLTDQGLDEWLKGFLALGRFELQPSKVKAFAAQMSREGNDQLAGVIRSAIRKSTAYRGVKSERK